MERVLRELIDLEKIRALEQSECQDPGEILGAHMEKVGCMISAFLPDTKQVSVQVDETMYPMDRVDSEGFFSVVLVDQMRLMPYKLYAEYENGETEEIEDPYSYRFPSQFSDEDLRKFNAGTFYQSYEKLGAHPISVSEVDGVHFAVWAPEAKRVSVVGDFNYWNGKRHQMKKVGKSGLYELFIPGLKPGMKYKYEVKTSNGELKLKADPYGMQAELRPATASVICGLGDYVWNDNRWMAARKDRQAKDKPLSIYEVHLGSWMQKAVEQAEDGTDINGSQFYTYGELAKALASYVKEMGYTHIELMPVMEHPLDKSLGYQVTGFYAPTSRFGTPDEMRGFIDHMHKNEIGVILDWVPTQFPKDAHGLAAFDGTCLYEHLDPRQGENKSWGTLIFNYGRPQVSNFLISNALYWAKEFHVDGIRINGLEAMLYLDYGKDTGEWIANLYGGHENLEAVEFLKHLNSIFHREVPGVLMIAEEAASWPRITGNLNEEGLGFDYKWNSGWNSDFLQYMKLEPELRKERYGDLTLSMLYAYSEDFILPLAYDESIPENGSMFHKMPGDDPKNKFADLRAAYGFFMGHPGKKLLFTEQEALPIKDYIKALNHLYISNPALYIADHELEGFEWINCTCEKENVVVFIRRGKRYEETLLFACNFGNTDMESFRFGVPIEGTWVEVLNSDEERFGGDGRINIQEKPSEPEEKDNRKQSISIRLAPRSVCVFSYKKEEDTKESMPVKEEAEEIEPIGKGRSKLPTLSIRPAKTAKAAGEAIAQKGADALDKLSETVGRIIKKK